MTTPQKECFWPSGKEIKQLSTNACWGVLRKFGIEGENVSSQSNRELRSLIRRLKWDSHINGDCECPSAGYIRAGGGRPTPPVE